MVENGNKRLDSWKEIAEYLGRDIRTAIRWEREKGLPVHRVPGGKRQVVFGLSEEIDSWLRNGAVAQDSSTQAVSAPVEPLAGVRPLAPTRLRRAAWAAIGIALLGLMGFFGLGYEWRQRLAHHSAGLVDRQLTANPAEDRVLTAAISPDGRHVAYSDLTGIFVRSTDSGETRPVPVPPELRDPPLRAGAWFPDGGKLLALRPTPEGTDIWMVPVLGEAAARLDYRFGYDPAISPDGRSVAFVSGEVGKLGRVLWVGGIDGRSPLKLATSDEYLGLRNPAWSPDGRWIAYWRNTGFPSSVSIEVRPAGGGPARTLIPASRLPRTYWQPFHAMIWSPDWRLFFSITEDSEAGQGDGGIWALLVDKASGEARGQAERMARWNDQVLSSLTATADGKRLAMVKTRILDDVYVGDFERCGSSMKPPVRLTFDTRGSVFNSWTPDQRGDPVRIKSKREMGSL